MNRSLLIFLVVLAVFSGSFAEECGSNEEFKICGSACEPTCARPGARVCTFQCKIGCQCIDEHVRNSEGKCVPLKDC